MKVTILFIASMVMCGVINAQEAEIRNSPRIDDFKSIERGNSVELLIGGAINTFTGNAQYYLNTGGGVKVDIIFMGQRKFGAGLAASFYANDSKKPYPINTISPQASSHPTFFLGLAGHRVIDENERRQIKLQFEANYVQQNLNKRLEIGNNDVTRFNGFSPGILVHYLLKFGSDRVGYVDPVIMNNWLNFHVGIRPLLYNTKFANGIMIEAGISYRLKVIQIKSYELKREAGYYH